MTLQGEFYIEHETEAFIAPGKPQQIFGSKAKDEKFQQPHSFNVSIKMSHWPSNTFN